MQVDIQEAILNEIEHAKNFLLIQDEDIELIKKRLNLITANQHQ
ncbi:hypothetical protein [Mucilaginibacter panaciglaebae]|uniref:Uncharacterized protein n=1 Tax=Mucilaginibacter panaciglaebae TaxID=502331 RepID=A0ABP7WY24_9SPHI